MATIADLLVKIGADTTELRKELTAVQRQLKSTFGTQGMAASSKALTILTGIGASITAIGTASIYAAAKLQTINTAFETMTGSESKAKALVADLEAFAAKTTISFTTASEAAKKFLSFGYEAEQIIPTLNAVADAAAGIGMTTSQINKVTLTLAKMADQTKLTNANMTALIRTGLPVWEMLADEMGTTVVDAQEKVTKGAIEASEGISMLVNSMQTKYAGAMEKLAATLAGAWTTLTTGVEQAMGQVGLKIAEALDISGTIQNLGNMFVDFGKVVATSGISEALRTVIPPEFSAAAVAIGTTLVGVAIPALVMLGTTVAGLVAPFLAATAAALPWIAAAAAIAAGLFYLWQSGVTFTDVLEKMGVDMEAVNKVVSSAKELIERLKTSFSNLCDSLQPVVDILKTGLAVAFNVALKAVGLFVDYLVWAVGCMITEINLLVDGFNWLLDKTVEIFTSIGDIFSDMADRLLPDWAKSCLSTISDFVGSAMSSLGGFIKTITGANDEVAKSTEAMAETTSASLTRVDYSNLAKGAQSARKSIGEALVGITAAGTAIGGTTVAMNKSISDEWNKMFTTRIDQVKLWYKQESETLEKSRKNNMNYATEVQRLNDLNAQKMRNAQLEQEKSVRSISESIVNLQRTSAVDFIFDLSDGEQKLIKMQIEQQQACDTIRKNWQALSDSYATMTKEDQKIFEDTLKERQITYEKLGEDRLSFEAEIQNEINAKNAEYAQKEAQMRLTLEKEKADIQQAYNELNMENLQKYLTDAYAAETSFNAARKELMETYEQAFLQSHMEVLELVSSLSKEALTGLETAFTDILTGAEDAKAAFEALGKSMIKVIANYFAKMTAGMIMSAVLGKQQDAAAMTETAANAATAQALWAPPAWLKLVVSPGSAGTATALLTAGVTSSAALGSASAALTSAVGTVKGYASGGLFTRPIMGILGDGTEDEVALPLNRSVFESIANGITNEAETSTGGTVNATQNVYGDINNGSDIDDLWDGFSDMLAAGLKGY